MTIPGMGKRRQEEQQNKYFSENSKLLTKLNAHAPFFGN